MVCWLVGGKCAFAKWFQINNKQSQTSKGANRNNFYVNPDHPRRPQTPLTKLKKIQILTDFENGQVTTDLPRVNWQLSPHASRQFFLVFYMDRLFWAKRWALQLER